MGKGEVTRHSILSRAVSLASTIGLEGLSIGTLASELALSKSGLFAHFRSKEALQIQVLDAAAARFIDVVVRPSVKAKRGIPRVRALFENWLLWGSAKALPGGCLFIAASAELDDKPGPVRDRLVQLQKDWQQTRTRVLQTAIDNGDFRPDADARQLAHDFFAIALGFHYATRLLRDPNAERYARAAFERLVECAKP